MADQQGTDDLVVLLGTPSAESSKLYAMTVSEGDPAWAGALAGVSLNLPAYHVLEEEVKEAADEDVYDSEVGISAIALEPELDEIVESVKGVRSDTMA